jgi:hypothetical protein
MARQMDVSYFTQSEINDFGAYSYGPIPCSILRDASRSLSSGAHSRDPLAMLLRMRSVILMVRSREAASRTMKATVSR